VLYGIGLDHTPPYLHRDEVEISLQAHSIATTGRDLDGRLLPLYFRMKHLGPRVWFHPIIVYVTAASQQVLPIGEAWFRVPTVFVGLINIVLMYFVARRLFSSTPKGVPSEFGDRWALTAAALLAMTPAHFMHSRLAFDFIYPLPFVLAWLLGLQIFLERRQSWILFVTTTALGIGFYSYIASIIMMPIYLALTIGILIATRTVSVKACACAVAGFAWPLLLLIPWIISQPGFIGDIFNRYGEAAQTLQATSTARVNFAALAERVTLYWSFLDPSFLFLSGGYTRMTNSTRLVGVFLAPLIVLVPLGVFQVLTVRRSPMSVLVLLGFFLAPIAPTLSVLEPYASDRELAVLVFGVLLATFGVERVLAWRGRWLRPAALLLLAFLPQHFLFFLMHYFGDYHRRSASWYEWNHPAALEAIIDRETGPAVRPVYLSSGVEKNIEAFWMLSTAKRGRRDLLAHTVYFDSKTLDLASVPPGSLLFVTVDDRALLDAVATGRLREVMHAEEPADAPVFYVLEKL
jgi:4-amino-4-deoxy-L-arabinose transferase-like glycosyltransferase